jgi:large subunit ribosomal protein L6
MSRIGKLPIIVPKDVKIELDKNNEISIKGPCGESRIQIPKELTIEVEPLKVSVTINDNSLTSRSMWGLFRTLIANDIAGAAKEFEKELQLVGVGYRCEIAKKVAILRLGYSHPINLPIPEGVTVTVENNTAIKITGPKKDVTSQFAAKLRSYRPPEPYNGKGVLYKGEVVVRKAGKSGKK